MSLSFIYPQYLWLLSLLPLTAALALFGRRGATRLRTWGGLALRLLLLALVVLALAGIQLRLRTDILTTVFLLDASDSIPPADQAVGEAFIRSAVEAMPFGDRAAVVVFGENALVERLASEDRSLAKLASVPVTTRTDIASALQLGLALFPNEGAKRLVLLSDGRENLGQALEQADLAGMQNIELLYTPLSQEQGDTEVLVDSLSAPGDVRQGQDFDLTVVVQNSSLNDVNATLRVFGDNDLLDTRELHLKPGSNRFLVPVQAGDQSGFRRFRAQIIPDQDRRLQNNEASAFTVVHGPPSILLVEGTAGEAQNMASALTAAKMSVEVISPASLPTTLPELARYDAVVLADVAAPDLPAGAMEALPVFVRELGKGLVMTGGQNAFGAGGYLRTPLEKALPVDMDVKNRDLSANLALVVAVDKSGSMGRCHCDNPDLNQTYTRREVGQPKVDIAKEAIMRSASALGPQDYLGVVAFDSQARWALKVSPLVDQVALEQSIGTIQAEGQTNLYNGVEAAYQALENVNAKRKHIILMTDGWVREGELNNLAKEMREKGITLSVVAAGGGSAQYLAALSADGGGRYYPATDILNVPDIFLKETVASVGQYIIEEPFYPLPAVPSPVLRGIDATTLPALLGYNGTTAKNTARLDLITPRGDPLLSSWQYGLGRAAVWTSDMKGQWATDWLKWEGFPRFAAQLVGWVLPAPQVEGLSASVSQGETGATIKLDAQDKEGRPLNFLQARATLIDPELTSQQVDLSQVGAGQYAAQLDLPASGTYLVRLGVNQGDASLGQMNLGLVVPYSPEYRLTGVNTGLLGELARRSGASGTGEILDPLAAFVHNLPSADYAREIWRSLLLVAALLFPLDVAVRRVMFTAQDYRKARAWVAGRLAFGRQPQPSQDRALGRLFSARQRARQRTGQRFADQPEAPGVRRELPSVRPAHPSQTPAPPPAAADAPAPEKPAPARTETEEESFARLRQAKRRARRDR